MRKLCPSQRDHIFFILFFKDGLFWRFFFSVADQIGKLVFIFFRLTNWKLLKVNAQLSMSLMGSFFNMRAKLIGKGLPITKTTVL